MGDENYERYLAERIYWNLRRRGEISEGGLRDRNHRKWDKIVPERVPVYMMRFDNPCR